MSSFFNICATLLLPLYFFKFGGNRFERVIQSVLPVHRVYLLLKGGWLYRRSCALALVGGVIGFTAIRSEKRRTCKLDDGFWASKAYWEKYPDVFLAKHACKWDCNCGVFEGKERAEYRSALVRSLVSGRDQSVPSLQRFVDTERILQAPTWIKHMLYFDLTLSELIETDWSRQMCSEASAIKVGSLGQTDSQVKEDTSHGRNTPPTSSTHADRTTKFDISEWDKLQYGKDENLQKYKKQSSQLNSLQILTEADLQRREWLRDCIVADHPHAGLRPILTPHMSQKNKYTRVIKLQWASARTRRRLYAMLQNIRPEEDRIITCRRASGPTTEKPPEVYSMGVVKTRPPDVLLSSTVRKDSRPKRRVADWQEPQVDAKGKGPGSYAWFREQSQRDLVEQLKRDGNTCVTARRGDRRFQETAQNGKRRVRKNQFGDTEVYDQPHGRDSRQNPLGSETGPRYAQLEYPQQSI